VRQVAYAGSGEWMIGPEGLLVDRERAPQEQFCARVIPLRLVAIDEGRVVGFAHYLYHRSTTLSRLSRKYVRFRSVILSSRERAVHGVRTSLSSDLQWRLLPAKEHRFTHLSG
jgi:hypothetical protein